MKKRKRKDRNEDVFIGVRYPLDHSQEGFFLKQKLYLNKQNLI